MLAQRSNSTDPANNDMYWGRDGGYVSHTPQDERTYCERQVTGYNNIHQLSCIRQVQIFWKPRLRQLGGGLVSRSRDYLTLKARNYFYTHHRDQRVFLLWNAYKYLS